MVDSSKRARVGSTAAKQMESAAVTHSTTRAAVTFEDRPQGAKGKGNAENTVTGRAAVCDMTNR